jgi:hypothetical protein
MAVLLAISYLVVSTSLYIPFVFVFYPQVFVGMGLSVPRREDSLVVASTVVAHLLDSSA